MESRPVPLLLIAIPVFFVALGVSSIWDANEAFYVETPRQMLVSGDFVNPTFNGEPRFNKPVLSYWIVAGFYRVFGVSVAVERLAIALGAIGILAGAWLIGRALRSPPAGALAALILATAPRFVFFSRRIAIDIYLACFMTLALACCVLAERDPARRRRYLLLMYVALGLAVLTKGPIALAIPALATAAWYTTERRWPDVRRLMLPAGSLIVLAIVLPWYGAIYAQHGWEYIRFFFIDENLGRFASPLTTERGPTFFLAALFADILLPWAPLIAVALISGWRRRPDPDPDPSGPIRRLLIWWVVVTVAVFSLSASKEDLYILPAIPAAAALVADLLVTTGYGATHRGVRAVVGGLMALTVVLAALVARYLTSGPYALASALPLALILAATGVAGVIQLGLRRPAGAVTALAAGFVLFNYVFVFGALRDVERLKPVPPIAAAIAGRAADSAPVASLEMDLPSLVFYTRRTVERLAGTDEAARFLTDNAEGWLVTGEREYNTLRARLPSICLAARAPQFLAKGSDVLRGQPPPDVLLVTNQCREARLTGPR